MSLASPCQVAAQLLAAMRGPAEEAAAGLAALLDEQVSCVALGQSLQGREAVVAELCRAGQRAAWQPLEWSAPEPVGARGARLTGRTPDGERRRGLVVGVHLPAQGAGRRIRRIELQRVPAPPPPATAIRLGTALRAAVDGALESRHPMLLACVSPEGQPVLSFRGSLQVHTKDALAMWARKADGLFVRSIRHNPRVALMFRDEARKATYQFQGRARVASDEPTRRAVYSRSPEPEQAHDFARLGVAIVIELDRVEGYAGLGPEGPIDPVLMLRQADDARASRPPGKKRTPPPRNPA